MKHLFKKGFLSVLILSLFVMAACSNDKSSSKEEKSQNDMKKVKVVLDWTPNTNHTGLYVAANKGYFKDEGLDVEIVLPGEAGADKMVAAGNAEFGVSSQEGVTYARVQDIPLVSIAAIIQHNTSGFASPVEKNITKPKDFEGKTYGGWGSPIEEAMITSLMKNDQADASKVKIINMGQSDFFTAVKRDIDFAWIFYGWTGIEAELRKEPLNMVYLTDYAKELDYYTPVLITNEKMVENDPKTVEAFMKAVSKGYEFAINEPEQAGEILLEAAPDLDRDLVMKSQEWLSPKYQDDAAQWGIQDDKVWKGYADWMTERKLLEGTFDSKKAFTNEFLPKP